MPVARALTGAHSTCLYLASFAQQPEIQLLVSRGQIVSGVLPLLTDGQTDTQTDNYNFSITSDMQGIIWGEPDLAVTIYVELNLIIVLFGSYALIAP